MDNTEAGREGSSGSDVNLSAWLYKFSFASSIFAIGPVLNEIHLRAHLWQSVTIQENDRNAMGPTRTSCGTDENISASKIQPLDSSTKTNIPRAQGEKGVAGFEEDINQSRISPLGGHGQYQHPAPHADSQGAVGTEGTIGRSKIAPLEKPQNETQAHDSGLSDEAVDSSRIHPLSEVREELG
ncbi:hypothetical protein VTK73DRAFT_5084 [Phialemonium thermophilum]|uniref:Uncharacterized protein n=1 Tax=Phialemonium thermophilum TaxID=223376 RepID=A0ABR3WQE2_9PEZI